MPALTWSDEKLFRNGSPHRILGGAIHYFRVHPGQWRDRLLRLQALGANTLDTYIAWNFHQPGEDTAPDFTGWRDVVAYVELAGELGFDVIIRPGPYICAEWDNGGIPAWLTARDLAPRTADPRWTGPIEAWFDELLPRLTGLQAGAGGPIVAWQAENEYGSFGDDADYLRWNVAALADRGASELIFTADGGLDHFLDGGTLPDVLAAATFGSGGAEALDLWRRRRPGEPMIDIEFWNGWFDHWGEEHHTRDAADAAAGVAEILDGGGSACLYMAHGGTSFGLWAGANTESGGGPGTRIQPTVTSYDYDAPIAEDGTLTDKFYAICEVFSRYAQGGDARGVPEVPAGLTAAPPRVPTATLPFTPGSGLLDSLLSIDPVRAPAPLTFEQLGTDAGLVVYSAEPLLGTREHRLRLRDLHDRAYVYQDGNFIGRVDELSEGVAIAGAGTRSRLDIVVENRGRINYGARLFEGKGILGGVLRDSRYIFGWEHRALDPRRWPVDSASGWLAADSAGTGPGWGSATLTVTEPADAWLTLPGFGRGYVWVNDFLLGRYDSAGPQHALYCPAPLVPAGDNTITVLELEARGREIGVNVQDRA